MFRWCSWSRAKDLFEQFLYTIFYSQFLAEWQFLLQMLSNLLIFLRNTCYLGKVLPCVVHHLPFFPVGKLTAMSVNRWMLWKHHMCILHLLNTAIFFLGLYSCPSLHAPAFLLINSMLFVVCFLFCFFSTGSPKGLLIFFFFLILVSGTFAFVDVYTLSGRLDLKNCLIPVYKSPPRNNLSKRLAFSFSRKKNISITIP